MWYAENQRTLPWRATKDPYRIWLSEIMLQQTRVVQGTPYYLKFLEHFPTVADLADAPEEKVLKLWQGLGYYSRARNLHATAGKIAYELDGKFPGTYTELLKLKGVGDYTASAIASICFNEAQPVVDGNVFRVLARYFGVERPIDGSQGAAFFKQLAREVMDVQNIRDYNQGIMEFGAMQCAPKNPNCLHCPLNHSCEALKMNKVDQLPVKRKAAKARKRYFNYMVVVAKDENGEPTSLLRQRKGKGIWQNLWEFPLMESDGPLDLDAVKKKLPEVLDIDGAPEVHLYNEEQIVHKLSHQHLHTKFWIVQYNGVLSHGVPFDSIGDYAVPVLLADFIKAFKI